MGATSREQQFRTLPGITPGELTIVWINGALAVLACLLSVQNMPKAAVVIPITLLAILAWEFPAAFWWVVTLFGDSKARFHPIPSVLFLLILLYFGNRSLLRVSTVPAQGNGGEQRKTEEKPTAPAPSKPEKIEDFPELSLLPPGTGANDDTQPGVILMPKQEPHPILVPPLPVLGRGKSLFSSKSVPLTIPFFGVYHFFRSRDRKLPGNSQRRSGDPSEVRFRSTDGSPLVMEAHQNLGVFIPTSCCSAVQLRVENRDPYRSTISLELIVLNSQSKRSQSLGTVPVTWSPPGIVVAEAPVVSDLLTFPLSLPTGFDRFDEFAVRYHLAPMRGERSAKLAVRQFVLIPAGL